MKVCEFGRFLKGRKEIFYEKMATPKAVWCGRQVAVTESLMSPLKKKKTKDKRRRRSLFNNSNFDITMKS